MVTINPVSKQVGDQLNTLFRFRNLSSQVASFALQVFIGSEQLGIWHESNIEVVQLAGNEEGQQVVSMIVPEDVQVPSPWDVWGVVMPEGGGDLYDEGLGVGVLTILPAGGGQYGLRGIASNIYGGYGPDFTLSGGVITGEVWLRVSNSNQSAYMQLVYHDQSNLTRAEFGIFGGVIGWREGIDTIPIVSSVNPDSWYRIVYYYDTSNNTGGIDVYDAGGNSVGSANNLAGRNPSAGPINRVGVRAGKTGETCDIDSITVSSDGNLVFEENWDDGSFSNWSLSDQYFMLTTDAQSPG